MKTTPWLFAALALSASCSDTTQTRRESITSGTLTLVRERELSELLSSDNRFEASGVALQDGALRVVFDNSTRVAEVDLALTGGSLGPGSKSQSQYEGITVATRPSPKTYVVKEIGAGGLGAIVTIDDQGDVVATEPTDIAFAGDKGLEGLAWLDDIERLLVLCEEGSCGAGPKGRGHGAIKALRHEGGTWATEATIELPSQADFEDFADLAVFADGDGTWRIAVLSQESAALWLGTLTTKPLAIAGAGIVYGFPQTAGAVDYCSLEGVTFIDRSTLAMVSDRLQDQTGCSKAEALHVFAIP